MSRKGELPQSKRHILIYDEDWDFLVQNFGTQSPSGMGVSAAIRKIVHFYCLRIRQNQVDKLDAGSKAERAKALGAASQPQQLEDL